MKNTRRQLDAATRRRLAVAASTDPRTIEKVYRGLDVRGLAGERARLVLEKEGYLPKGQDKRHTARGVG